MMIALVLSALLSLFIAGCITQSADAAVTTTPKVVYLRAEPNAVERNGLVTLSWQVRGLEHITIQQRYGSHKQAPDKVYDDLPAEGTLTVDLTRYDSAGAVSTPYIHDVNFWLLGPGDPYTPFIPGYTFLSSVAVQINCPYDGFFFGVDPYYEQRCPLNKAQTVPAIYQPFEYALLVWRTDNNTVYVLRRQHEQDTFGSALDFTGYAMDAADQSREDPFSRFLTANRQHGIIMGMGAATATATYYDMTVQDSYHDSVSSAVNYMTLPDGRAIRYQEDIYTSGWLCMTCSP
jgi:hypothetical protein